MDVIKGALKENILDTDPLLPKDVTVTDREIPIEDIALDAKAESDVHLEFIEIELPKLEAEDNDIGPNIRP